MLAVLHAVGEIVGDAVADGHGSAAGRRIARIVSVGAAAKSVPLGEKASPLRPENGAAAPALPAQVPTSVATGAPAGAMIDMMSL
jgi:hypothetical protein